MCDLNSILPIEFNMEKSNSIHKNFIFFKQDVQVAYLPVLSMLFKVLI